MIIHCCFEGSGRCLDILLYPLGW